MYEVSSGLLFVAFVSFLWSVDKSYAVILGGLQAMQYIAKILYYHELKKFEEEQSKKFDEIVEEIIRKKDV